MKTILDTIKGIHPGYVLERELKKRLLRKGQFALSVGEFPQTLTAITKGKRRMNIALARKIEKVLSIEEGYFMVLQVYYDIEQEKKKENKQQKKAVIKRIFERGNEEEKKEISRFYGPDTVTAILNS